MWESLGTGAVVIALAGALYRGHHRRIEKLEEKKADKEDMEQVQDCLTGKGGLKEMLVRIDERVNFLYEERKNGPRGVSEN